MEILNVKITTDSKDEIIRKVTTAINHHQKFTIFTPNPEIITYAVHNPSFQKLLNTADVNLADGVGLKIGCNLKNVVSKIPFEIIHGIDFMMDLCREAEKHGWSVGLLGGRNGAAEKTRNELLRRYPRLKLAYICGDLEFEAKFSENSDNSVNQKIRTTGNSDNQNGISSDFSGLSDSAGLSDSPSFPSFPIDILFVALGSPKEQLWIAENRATFPATVFMQVGGAFDIIGGTLPRAPRLMRRLGLEWMWRLWLQPKRIWRQLRLVEFLVRYLFT